MKNARFKKMHFFFSSVLIFMIHLPFSFANLAKPKENEKVPRKHIVRTKTNKVASLNVCVDDHFTSLYDSLKLDVLGLSHMAFDYAIAGMEKLKRAGKIANDQLISIVDFTKSSSEKRLFVIDLENRRLLFNTYVAHGQNSGTEFAKHFSNAPESFQSSLGFYQTATTYNGKNGYSLHLVGLEKGINSNADERAIVMHGADYVSERYIREKGYIGRSWGCPAVPEKLNKPIIETIKNGTCLFIFGANNKYIRRSKILNS